jgi:hypothetical protein
MTDLELKLPDEVMENIPSGNKEDVVRYLAKYFDTIIDRYDHRFQQRITGPLGGPLSNYEKSLLKDFLIDQTLGKIEEATLKEVSLAAETITR